MEHVRGVQVRRQDPVKSMNKLWPKLEPRPPIVRWVLSDFEPGNQFSYPYCSYLG